MKRIVKLTESDITRIVRRVIMEGDECPCEDGTKSFECCPTKELEGVEVSIMKFNLSKPEEGVRFVVYDPRTGDFTENGRTGDVWARTQPNLSKKEVTDWFKRNNIKIK
jgi:hypothetical protein